MDVVLDMTVVFWTCSAIQCLWSTNTSYRESLLCYSRKNHIYTYKWTGIHYNLEAVILNLTLEYIAYPRASTIWLLVELVPWHGTKANVTKGHNFRSHPPLLQVEYLASDIRRVCVVSTLFRPWVFVWGGVLEYIVDNISWNFNQSLGWAGLLTPRKLKVYKL